MRSSSSSSSAQQCAAAAGAASAAAFLVGPRRRARASAAPPAALHGCGHTRYTRQELRPTASSRHLSGPRLPRLPRRSCAAGLTSSSSWPCVSCARRCGRSEAQRLQAAKDARSAVPLAARARGLTAFAKAHLRRVLRGQVDAAGRRWEHGGHCRPRRRRGRAARRPRLALNRAQHVYTTADGPAFVARGSPRSSSSPRRANPPAAGSVRPCQTQRA